MLKWGLESLQEKLGYILIGEQKHFVPHPLPLNPALQLDAEALELYGQAMQQLGMLEEMVRCVPDNARFLNAYITKEAMLSSEIEGIHTTLIEVLGYTVNARGTKQDSTRLVCNYMDALSHAMTMVIDDGLPIVSRVIRDSHKVFLSGTNDDNDTPGVFRKVPVRVGQLVPPAAHRLEDLIANLELFIN